MFFTWFKPNKLVGKSVVTILFNFSWFLA